MGAGTRACPSADACPGACTDVRRKTGTYACADARGQRGRNGQEKGGSTQARPDAQTLAETPAGMHALTHAHVHVRAHAKTCATTHVQTRASAVACTDACVDAGTDAGAGAGTAKGVDASESGLGRTHGPKCACVPIRMHSCMRGRMHAHMHGCRCARPHGQAQVHARCLPRDGPTSPIPHDAAAPQRGREPRCRGRECL